MEEERRLCYVAMTRARQRLTMTTARQRMLYGRTSSNLPSRFLEELPEEPIDWQSKTEPASAPRWAGDAASIDPPAHFDSGQKSAVQKGAEVPGQGEAGEQLEKGDPLHRLKPSLSSSRPAARGSSA